MCTTKVSPAFATGSPLADISMPELSMATCPWGSLSTAKISPGDAATARCTSSRSGMSRLSHASALAGWGPLLVGGEHPGVQRPQLVLGDAGEADAEGLQGGPPVIVGGQVAGEGPVADPLVPDSAQHA